MEEREIDLTGHACGRPCPRSSQLRLSPGTHRLFFCSCIHAHFAAFFRALATGFGASSAVFILMLLALLGAGVTDIGTEVTDLSTELRVPAHKCCAGPAEVCTIDTKSGTLRHVTQTLVCAAFTLLSTSHTGVHTRLMLMSHWKILLY